jgi:threonine 3-dehydrogenase
MTLPAIPKTMKAVVKPYGKKGLELKEVETPNKIGPRDVFLKVLAASVCGTDLHIYDSDPSIRDRVADNQTIGHEFCGEVLEVGDQVTTLTRGDIVSSESHIVCGTCEYCLEGMPHLCQEVSLIGIDRPGGLAQYVVIPEQNAVPKRSDKISVEVASTLDAFGNAVDTALLVPLVGKTVLITGCGPQGLMAIAIALAAGAKQIIATEKYENRISLAKEVLRTHANPNQPRNDLILNANDKNLIDQVFEATGGLGVDVLLEMAGHPTAIRDGFFLLKNAGHAVILGITSSREVEVDWANLVFKGATIHFRYGRHLYKTWAQGRNLLESGLVKLEPLIHKPYFALEDFDQAFQLQIRGEVAKVIFTPNG